jgi:hypothetical protein
MRLLVSSLLVVLLSSCASGGAGDAPSADAAPVDAAVRALLTGYASATDGAQAEAAITLFSTPGLIERLKTQAAACRTAAANGQELPPSCQKDPLFCGDEPAPIAGVAVKNVSAGVASAEVGLTHASGAITALVSLAKVGDSWKVDSVTCPQ